MFFYWGLWFFVAMMTLLWRDKQAKSFNNILLCLLLILAVLVGARENVGVDWEHYKYYYETGENFYGKIVTGTEYFYHFLVRVCNKAGLSFGCFLLLLSLLSLLTLRKAILLSGVPNTWFVFLGYLSFVFCNYQFNIVRHGVMASLMILAYVYRARNENKKGIICMLLGIGFHISGLFLVGLYPFINKKIEERTLIVIGAILVLLILLGLNTTVSIYIAPFASELGYDSYLDTQKWGTADFSLGTFGSIVIYSYAYFFKKKLR